MKKKKILGAILSLNTNIFCGLFHPVGEQYAIMLLAPKNFKEFGRQRLKKKKNQVFKHRMTPATFTLLR